MRFAHLSDLHFGGLTCKDRLRGLAEDLAAQEAKLLVLTGDITDRGRISQFRWARAFLDSLAVPFIAVPGNREIGISAAWEWLVPRLAMGRFRRFFGSSDRVLYSCHDEKVAFFGLNSVHPFPSWPGTITRETRYWLKAQAPRFSGYAKVLFLHHPVIPAIRGSSFWAHTFSEAGEVLNIATQTGIGLILQGHKHRSSVVEIHIPERRARVVVSAGGAPLTSRWDSTYHLIDLDGSDVAVTPREFRDGEFRATETYRFSMVGREE
jgi:3',5'-cyclic AMP phosphodiesterase CpdA